MGRRLSNGRHRKREFILCTRALHRVYVERPIWGIVRGATSSWLKSRAVCQSLGTDSRNTERRACFSGRKWKSAARIRASARVQEQLLDCLEQSFTRGTVPGERR